jgi:hypothetical protein
MPYQILRYIVFIQLFKKTRHIYYVIRHTTWSSVHPSPPILPCTWRMELKIVMNDHCKMLTKCCYFFGSSIYLSNNYGFFGLILSQVSDYRLLEASSFSYISHQILMQFCCLHWLSNTLHCI